MTIVINLFGGPGCGKSQAASELFSLMKKQHKQVEYVQEYCKSWAWQGKEIGDLDQLYFLGKQSHYEARLYGKVDYIITDSPILLAGIYQDFKSGREHRYTGEAAKAFMQHAESNGVYYKNYFLERAFPFDPNGRWESQEEAEQIDGFILAYLSEAKAPFEIVFGKERDWVVILDRLLRGDKKKFKMGEIWELQISPNPSRHFLISHVVGDGNPVYQYPTLWRVGSLSWQGSVDTAELFSLRDGEVIVVKNEVPDDPSLATLCTPF